jgi:hypothetical protein
MLSESREVIVLPATSFSANAAKPDEGFRSRLIVDVVAEFTLGARDALLAVSGGWNIVLSKTDGRSDVLALRFAAVFDLVPFTVSPFMLLGWLFFRVVEVPHR